MVSCHEMKKGQVYECKGCGFELEVVSECACKPGSSDSACGADSLGFQCCGEDLVLKS